MGRRLSHVSKSDLARWAVGLALLGVTAYGVIALWPDLATDWNYRVVALFGLFLGFRAIPTAATHWIALVLGGAIVPIFALLGFDALLSKADVGRPDAGPSLVIGIAVLVIAFAAYFATPWVHVRIKPWLVVTLSVGLAVGLVVLPPLGLHLWGELHRDTDEAPPKFASRLEVIVLGEAVIHSLAGERLGWRINTWPGRVDGKQITWGATGQPPEVGSDVADRVVMLAVDGDSPGAAASATRASGEEVRRWLALADQVSTADTPTYALLARPDPDRATVWKAALGTSVGSPRHGAVFDLASPGGAQDLTDVALQLAVLDPASTSNLALAAKYRPALFFDGAERYGTPLNVDEVIGHRLFRQCFRAQRLTSFCPDFASSADIDTAASNFAFNPADLAALGAQESEDPQADRTTIYVHVSRSGNDGLNLVYLDYWWYLADNPTGAGRGGLCGPGFVIAGITCFDHQSDWEGVTVILDADKPPDAEPLAVGYAEHDGVTRYSWKALHQLWDGGGDLERFGSGIDTGHRPLVFVANGTHAAYPESCVRRARSTHCQSGGVPGVKFDRPLADKRHNGHRGWGGNDESNCRAICLQPLPTHNNGSEPARWSAFAGRWGSSNCVLGVVFCSSAQPPQSPGIQKRYKKPWCRKEEIDLVAGGFVKRDGACPERQASAEEILAHERLLAMGDSYSSGEGAGGYDPATNRHGNTCHRSKAAWPQRLAPKLGLTALESLACSGALTHDVTDGRADSSQPERRASQIGRIPANANVITLTIGGNDVHFRDVLIACIALDCKRAFHRPSGDVLDARVVRLRKRLPEVYRAIRAKAPKAKLIVSGYPRLFPADPGPKPVGNCAAGKHISAEEAEYINEKTVNLDRAIADAAAEAGVQFVDVYAAFDGHELRCGKDEYLNRLHAVPGRLSGSFHPTAAGYQRLADVIARQVWASPTQKPGA